MQLRSGAVIVYKPSVRRVYIKKEQRLSAITLLKNDLSYIYKKTLTKFNNYIGSKSKED